MFSIYGSYFFGNKISDYGLQHGFVDYATLAKAFDAVLNNDIMNVTADFGEWESVGGPDYDEETETYYDVYQVYIVSAAGAEILQEVGEIVYYNDALNMYCWGVTHWGTSWDYVLTSIPCNTGELSN